MIKNNKDVEALLALAIANNKSATISALNSSGYSVDSNISDADLFVTLRNIWAKEGIAKLADVLSKISIDKSKLTDEQKKNLTIKYKDVSDTTSSKFTWSTIGDFLSGSVDIFQNANVTNQFSEPILPAWAVVGTVIIGALGIVFLFAKQVKNALPASIVIGVLMVGVIIFGSIAKKTTITQTGGGGSQTVHHGALTWLDGLLNGLNVHVG